MFDVIGLTIAEFVGVLGLIIAVVSIIYTWNSNKITGATISFQDPFTIETLTDYLSRSDQTMQEQAVKHYHDQSADNLLLIMGSVFNYGDIPTNLHIRKCELIIIKEKKIIQKSKFLGIFEEFSKSNIYQKKYPGYKIPKNNSRAILLLFDKRIDINYENLVKNPANVNIKISYDFVKKSGKLEKKEGHKIILSWINNQ